jgi:hypothetical protein
MATAQAVSRLEAAVRRLVADLRSLRKRIALVGALAVSARAEPRFTRDADFGVAVSGDPEAEALVADLQSSGYRVVAIVEQEKAARLATARLAPPGEPGGGIVLDLLFASCGIEPEIVAAAETLEVFPGLTLPVARVGHLLAMKVLSRDDLARPQDLADLRALAAVAGREELARAREAIALIASRTFARGRDLTSGLDEIVGTRG